MPDFPPIITSRGRIMQAATKFADAQERLITAEVELETAFREHRRLIRAERVKPALRWVVVQFEMWRVGWPVRDGQPRCAASPACQPKISYVPSLAAAVNGLSAPPCEHSIE